MNSLETEIKSLQAEIKGLEVMESQMSHDLQLMKRRKEIGELSKTWSGKALQVLGWAFSVYCIYRVAMVWPRPLHHVRNPTQELMVMISLYRHSSTSSLARRFHQALDGARL